MGFAATGAPVLTADAALATYGVFATSACAKLSSCAAAGAEGGLEGGLEPEGAPTGAGGGGGGDDGLDAKLEAQAREAGLPLTSADALPQYVKITAELRRLLQAPSVFDLPPVTERLLEELRQH